MSSRKSPIKRTAPRKRTTPRKKTTPRKRTTKKQLSKMTPTQVSDAKKIVYETANSLPPYVKNMRISSKTMACRYGANRMVCERSVVAGHDISCQRKGANEVTCMADGLKFKCHRKNNICPMTCNIRRM